MHPRNKWADSNVPVSKPLVLCDGSALESRSSRNESSPWTSGRLQTYRNERHNAATPKIVVEDKALQGNEGASAVAPESVARDIVPQLTLANNIHPSQSRPGELTREEDNGK